MVSEGVLTRTVRDTADVLGGQPRTTGATPHCRPSVWCKGRRNRRLRIGLVLEVGERRAWSTHRRAPRSRRRATLLEKAGHSRRADRVAGHRAVRRGLLAVLGVAGESRRRPPASSRFDRSFDARRLDGLTVGLRRVHRRNLRAHARRDPPPARRAKHAYAGMFTRHELVLSPVLAHVTPQIGYLSPTVPFERAARSPAAATSRSRR